MPSAVPIAHAHNLSPSILWRMNLELLRTFDHSYPEHNDGILDCGSEAVVCQFNRRGTMLAVGCNDGRIAIWDFMTRGIARQLSSHIHPITSLSWNRSGRKLLSAATDWNVILWDVASGEAELRLRFPSPVAKVQYNPRDRHMFLVCPLKHVPTLVTLKGDEPTHSTLPTDGEPEANMSGAFNRHGKLIVLGSSKGKVGNKSYQYLFIRTPFSSRLVWFFELLYSLCLFKILEMVSVKTIL